MDSNLLLPIALDLLLKSTGILLIAFAVQALWRRASAAQHCLVWGVVFAVLLPLPLTLLMTPRWSFALERPQTAPLTVAPAVHIEEDWSSIQEVASVPMLAVPPVTQWSTTQIVFGVWIAGIMLVLGQRLLGAWQVLRLRRRSNVIDDVRVTALTKRLAHEFGIVRRIVLREGAHVSVPLTWGVFRPVLLLPRQSLSWSDAAREAALRHELGHIRHFDAATRLLACVVCAVFWPNVLVWLAAKMWRTAQEQACDDLVLRAGTGTQDYAMQLLDAARSMKTNALRHAPVMAMARPSTLETRLSAIMDETRNRRPLRGGAWIAGGGSVMTLLALCASMQLSASDKDGVKPPGALQADGKTVLPQFEITAKFIEAPELGADADLVLLGKETLSGDETKALLQAIGQWKGIDILSSPTITTRAGQRADVQIGHELIYSDKLGPDGRTPVAFEMKVVGVTLQVTPALDDAGRIRLRLVPVKRELLGWMSDAKPGELFADVKNLPKENRLGQPVFLELATDREAVLAAEETAVCALNGITVTPGFEKLAKRRMRVWCLVSAKLLNPEAGADIKDRAEGNAAPQTTNSALQGVPKTQSASRNDELTERSRAFREHVNQTLEERVLGNVDSTKTGGTAEPGDLYFEGFQAWKAGQKLETEGNKEGAIQKYLEAQKSMRAVTQAYPDWQAEIVKYRLKTVDQTLSRLGYVPPAGTEPAISPAQQASDASRVTFDRANEIKLPTVEFRDATFDEAIDILRAKSKESDPQKRGLNLIVADAPASGVRLTLHLSNVSLRNAVKYVAELAGLKLRYDPGAIAIVSAGDAAHPGLYTRIYRTPSLFLGESKNAKEWLVARGVTFPEGSSASWVPTARQLIVRNTPAEQDKVQGLVEKAVEAAPADVPLLNRAEWIILPRVKFSGATVEEALKYLQIKSREYDPGVGIESRIPPGLLTPTITLDLRNVSLAEALRSVAKLAGLKVVTDKNGLVLEGK